MTTERAILANGCFWGSQELLRHLPGVISTRTGYSGDPATPNATYRRHGDHAEAVTLLRMALVDARRLRLPEAGQIQQILAAIGASTG